MRLKKLFMFFVAATLIVSAMALSVIAEYEETFEVGVTAETAAPISSSPYIVNQGEEITVQISVNKNAGISILSFMINYDLDALEYVSHTEDVLMGGTIGVNEENGYLLYTMIDLERINKTTGDCFTITFRTKADFCGDAAIDVELRMNDPYWCLDKNENVIPFVGNKIDMQIHNIDAESGVVTDPTCLEKGFTTYYCSACESDVVGNYVDALGHTLEYVDAQDATCTEIGWGAYEYCSVCDYTTYSEIAATGHSLTVVEAKEPTCTSVGWEAYEECSACDYTTYVEIPTIGHSYESVVTEPTCTEDGYTTYTCHCGDTYNDDFVDAYGHSFGEWIVEEKPTCTNPGVQRRYCENCDAVESDTLSSYGHTPVVIEKVDATCEEDGATAGVKCAICDVVLIAPTVVPATGHNEVAIIAVSPTCTTAGQTAGSRCSECDAVFTEPEVIPALGHSFSDWIIDRYPTCEETGSKHHTCTVCSFSGFDSIPATGHTSAVVPAVAPTCTETGLTEGTKCAVCDEILVAQQVVPAKGHVLEYFEKVDPTCTTEGLSEGTKCTVCHTVTEAQEKIPALGHSDEVIIPAVAPTCTETGLTEGKKCGVCGDVTVEQEIVAALGHTFGDWIVDKDATCVDEGAKHHVCEVCDASFDAVIPALGHIVVIIPEIAPTCTEVGYTEGRQCGRCEEILVNPTEIPATDHNFNDWVTTVEPGCVTKGESKRECKACDHYETKEVAPRGHILASIGKVEPDCVNAGSTAGMKCSVCDEILLAPETIPAKGHSFDSWIVDKEATCVDDGIKHHVCTVCDYSETAPIPAFGHTEEIDEAVAPTCTETGLTEGKHCSVCNEVLDAQETVDALGHTAGDVVVENNVLPDCVTDGSFDNVIYCTVCDAELSRETVVVEALGHTEGEVVVENNVAPDCVTEGSYDNVVYCTVCEAELSRETVTVDALGHTEGEIVVENNVLPDCVTEGSYDNVVYCTVCEAEVSRETVTVSAVGHSEGEIVVENNVAPDCVTDGSYDNVIYCINCEAELSRETVTVEALGHTEAIDEAVAPTCTATGLTEGKHCSVCQEVLVAQETVAAVGHNDANADGKCDACDLETALDHIVNTDDGAKVEPAPEGGAVLPDGTTFVVDTLSTETISKDILDNMADRLGGRVNALAYYDLSLSRDGAAFQPNGKLLITLAPVEGEYDSIKVVYIADDGSIEECKTTVNADGTVSFETDHFSKYAIVGVDNGLSTGAIVGIVIGSIVVAGIVAFVVVWFVIKKKTWKKEAKA